MLIIRRGCPILGLALLVVVAGCASDGIKDYESRGEKNLRIDARIEPNSFGSVRGSFLHVFAVSPRCELGYLGTVTLDKPTMEVGLPTDKPLLLRAEFVARQRFSESSTHNTYAYFVQLRPGYDYAADIQQQERLYKFALMEKRRGGGPGRAVERKGLEQCGPK